MLWSCEMEDRLSESDTLRLNQPVVNHSTNYETRSITTQVTFGISAKLIILC